MIEYIYIYIYMARHKRIHVPRETIIIKITLKKAQARVVLVHGARFLNKYSCNTAHGDLLIKNFQTLKPYNDYKLHKQKQLCLK